MTTYYKGFPQSTREEKLHMVNLNELENEAKYVIPEAAYYYIASGAENEWTWRNNTQAFNHFQIVPRALTGMQDPELNTEFFRDEIKDTGHDLSNCLPWYCKCRSRSGYS